MKQDIYRNDPFNFCVFIHWTFFPLKQAQEKNKKVLTKISHHYVLKPQKNKNSVKLQFQITFWHLPIHNRETSEGSLFIKIIKKETQVKRM